MAHRLAVKLNKRIWFLSAKSFDSKPAKFFNARLLRRGVRFHPVNHSAFADDVAIVVGACAAKLSYIMVPKVEYSAMWQLRLK